MRVEVDLAQMHLTIGDATINLGAFARAVEAMDDLTHGFTVIVTALVRQVSDSLSKGAAAIRESVTTLPKVIPTTALMVLEESRQKQTFPFPIPEIVRISPGAFNMVRGHKITIAGPTRWARKRRTDGACTTCSAMSGNGGGWVGGRCPRNPLGRRSRMYLPLGTQSSTVPPMQVTSYSELRRNLAATLDSVVNDHTPVIITRDRGKPAAVLMSLEDYASFEETRYLLSSPRNAERLLSAIANLEAGGGEVRELVE